MRFPKAQKVFSCAASDNGERGYTILELLLVVGIIALIGAFTWSLKSRSSVATPERVLNEVDQRLLERRSSAVRLNAIQAPTSLENYIAPPVEIDFSDLNTTASLITDGIDDDHDGRDDNTGAFITHLSKGKSYAENAAMWVYYYREDAMKLPVGWHLVSSQTELAKSKIPLIGGGSNGRGIVITKLAFDSKGSALGFVNDSFQSIPDNAVTDSDDPSMSPFWAIYFIPDSRNNSQEAVAVAIHPTGYTELWRFDGTQWQGFGRRSLHK